MLGPACCRNRCCTSKAATHSPAGSLKTASVAIVPPLYSCRSTRPHLDIPGIFFIDDPPCREVAACSDSLTKRNKIGAETRGANYMKYILLMTGTKEGADAYKSWSEKDIQTHFAHLTKIRKDLSKSGEFVATEGLGMP